MITDRVVCESCAAAKYPVADPSKSNRSKRRCSSTSRAAPGLPLHEVRASSSRSVLSLEPTGQSASALCLPRALPRFQDQFSFSQMCGPRGKTFDEDGGSGTTAQAFAEGEQPCMFRRVVSLFMYQRVADLFGCCISELPCP